MNDQMQILQFDLLIYSSKQCQQEMKVLFFKEELNISLLSLQRAEALIRNE